MNNYPTLEIRNMDGDFTHPITTSDNVMTSDESSLDKDIIRIEEVRDGLVFLAINKQEFDSLLTPDPNTMYLVKSTPTDVPILPSDNWYSAGTFDMYMAAGSAAVIHGGIMYIMGQGSPNDNSDYLWGSFYALDIISGAVSKLPDIPSHPHPTYPDITSSRLGKFNNVKLHIYDEHIIFMTNDSYDMSNDDPARVAKSYNIQTKTWSELPSIPGDKHTSICFKDNFAYFVGGLRGNSLDISNIIYKYDIVTGHSIEIGRLPKRVYYPFVSMHGTKLYIMSGVEYDGSMYGAVSRNLQILDIFDNIWDIMPDVFPSVTGSEPTRYLYLNHGCCNINNMIYLWSTTIPSIEVNGKLEKLRTPIFSINTINNEFSILSQVPISLSSDDDIRYITCASSSSNIFAMGMATDTILAEYDTNIMRYGGVLLDE